MEGANEDNCHLVASADTVTERANCVHHPSSTQEHEQPECHPSGQPEMEVLVNSTYAGADSAEVALTGCEGSVNDYSTLKRNYEELKQRYDSLRAIVHNNRLPTGQRLRRTRGVKRTLITTTASSEADCCSSSSAEEVNGGGQEAQRQPLANSDRLRGEQQLQPEVDAIMPGVRRVTRSESRRRGRPPKIATATVASSITSSHPPHSCVRAATSAPAPASPSPPPASPLQVSAASTPPPHPQKLLAYERKRRRASLHSSPPTYQQQQHQHEQHEHEREQQQQQLRKQRKDKGQRRSSLQPQERRRLWRQNRPLNKCDSCEYESRDKTCFRNHVAGHQPGARRRYVCDICSKSFRCKRGIQNHKLSHDAPERLHRCAHCNFTTPHKLNWVQHLAVIHKVDLSGNPVAESITCAQCSFTCVANHQLKAHVLRKHTLDKPFKCEQCDYSTVIRHELETHVGIRHKNERRYMCDLCGFRSQTQGGLTRHKRTHTGAKPFKCNMCGYCYADSGKLKTHLLRHTSDEKPYVCHVCGHASRRRDNLRMHLKRIHGSGLEAIRGHRRFQQSLLQHHQPDLDHDQQPFQHLDDLDGDDDGELEEEDEDIDLNHLQQHHELKAHEPEVDDQMPPDHLHHHHHQHHHYVQHHQQHHMVEQSIDSAEQSERQQQQPPHPALHLLDSCVGPVLVSLVLSPRQVAVNEVRPCSPQSLA